jgi:hypothetical protein
MKNGGGQVGGGGRFDLIPLGYFSNASAPGSKPPPVPNKTRWLTEKNELQNGEAGRK